MPGRENGHPPLPPHPPHPERKQVCRKYVWGTCNKYSECKFRHELIFEEMKGILKFCHDYQNNQLCCSRPGCSYLHTSSEEENLFLTAGTMPRVLLERHAAMNAAAPMIVNENLYVTSALAPPPPPPAAPPPVTPMLLMPPPPPPPRSQPSTTALAVPPVQHPPPPPNHLRPQPQPPRYTDTDYMATVQQPLYGTQSPSNSMQNSLPMFDTSRPPPPLPHVAETTGKRKSTNAYEAGPVKSTRRSPIRQCTSCDQLDTSLTECKSSLETLINLEADKNYEYRQKIKDFETKKRLVLSLLNAEHRRPVEEFIEGVSSDFSSFGLPQNQPQQNNMGSASVKEVFIKLLDFALDGSRRLEQASALLRNVEDASLIQNIQRQPSTNYQDEGLIQMLRAANTIASSPNLSQQVEETVRPYSTTGNDSSTNVNQRPSAVSSSPNGYYGPISATSRSYPEQPSPSTSQVPPHRPPAPYPAYHPGMPPPPVTYGQYQYQNQQLVRPPPPPQTQHRQQHPPPPPGNGYPHGYQSQYYHTPYQ